MNAAPYVPRHERAKRPTQEEWWDYDTKPIWVMPPPKGDPPIWPALAVALALSALALACAVNL